MTLLPIAAVAVKSASTAATVTDPAQVVSLSPNSPLPAGANLAGDVGVQYRANATGAASIAKVFTGATTNATSVKASAGRILSFALTNTAAAVRFLHLHNKASAPTVGTDVPTVTIALAAGQFVTHTVEGGSAYPLGIAYSVTAAASATDLDATVTAAGDVQGAIYYV